VVAVFDGPGNFWSWAVLVQSSLSLFSVLRLDFQALTSAHHTESPNSAPEPTPASVIVTTAQAAGVSNTGAGTGACGKIMWPLKKRNAK